MDMKRLKRSIQVPVAMLVLLASATRRPPLFENVPVCGLYLLAFLLLGIETYYLGTFLRRGEVFYSHPAALLLGIQMLASSVSSLYEVAIPVRLLLVVQLAEVFVLFVRWMKKGRTAGRGTQLGISFSSVLISAELYCMIWFFSGAA